MREVGPRPDLRWRADNPPTPRPALDAPSRGRGVRPDAPTPHLDPGVRASGLTPPSTSRSFPSSAPRPTSQAHRRLGLWLLGAAVCVLVGNPELRAAALGQIESGLELAGLGLQQVTIAGHRYTADTDIYAALDLDNARTLLTFDPRTAKVRIIQPSSSPRSSLRS